MMKELLAFLFLIGMAFSLSVPSCMPMYSVAGVNMTILPLNTNISCDRTASMFFVGINSSGYAEVALTNGSALTGPLNTAGDNWFMVRPATTPFTANLTVKYIAEGNNTINNVIATAGVGFKVFCSDTAATGLMGVTGTRACNVTSINSTTYNVTCTVDSGLSWCAQDKSKNLSVGGTGGNANAKFNVSTRTASGNTQLTIPPPFNGYFTNQSGYFLWSDIPGFNNVVNNSFSNANTYNAFIYYQTTQLTPLITLFPGQAVYPNFRNTTTNAAYLYSNTPAYIFDASTFLWYFVPPNVNTNLSVTYTLAAYLATGNTAAPGMNTTPPTLPNSMYCQQNGDFFNISSVFSVPVSHNTAYGNNTTILFDTGSLSTYTFAVNTTQYPYVNYTVNGNTMCLHVPGDGSLLPLPVIPHNGITDFLGQIIFVAMLGVGVFQPFAMLFVIGFNQMFSIVTAGQMALLAVCGIVLSVLLGGYDRFSVKGLFMYVMLMVCVFIQIYTAIGYSSTPLTNLVSSFNGLSGTGSISDQLVTFVGAAPTFMISLFIAILSLPGIVTSAILYPLSRASPPIFNIAVAISNGLGIALYGYLLIKAYEVLSNKFRDV